MRWSVRAPRLLARRQKRPKNLWPGPKSPARRPNWRRSSSLPRLARIMSKKPELLRSRQRRLRRFRLLDKIDQTATASLRQEEIAAAPTEGASETANPEFRWPARGRIIQGFNFGRNDGINIAVPEGTPRQGGRRRRGQIRRQRTQGLWQSRADSASERLRVGVCPQRRTQCQTRRSVKRGQTTSKAGQTGNVTTPQFHFELRKGASPSIRPAISPYCSLNRSKGPFPRAARHGLGKSKRRRRSKDRPSPPSFCLGRPARSPLPFDRRLRNDWRIIRSRPVGVSRPSFGSSARPEKVSSCAGLAPNR